MTAAHARMLAAKAQANPLTPWQTRSLANIVWLLDNYPDRPLPSDDQDKLKELAR
jgi:hypothetical protein